MIPLTIASMALSAIPLVSANKNDKLSKYVIPIMAITAVGGVAYVGYKFLKKDELPKLEQNPNYPNSSLSSVEAKAIAERLYAAMSGVGTDEEGIKNALSGLSANDFIKVYDAFGMRQYSLFWGNVGDPLSSDKHHLITWLTNELSDNEIKALEKIIPNLLTVKQNNDGNNR